MIKLKSYPQLIRNHHQDYQHTKSPYSSTNIPQDLASLRTFTILMSCKINRFSIVASNLVNNQCLPNNRSHSCMYSRGVQSNAFTTWIATRGATLKPSHRGVNKVSCSPSRNWPMTGLDRHHVLNNKRCLRSWLRFCIKGIVLKQSFDWFRSIWHHNSFHIWHLQT